MNKIDLIKMRRDFVGYVRVSWAYLVNLFIFTLVLFIYLFRLIILKTLRFRLWKQRTTKAISGVDLFFAKLMVILGDKRENTVSRIDLIDLSFRNMLVKKTRTLVTVGGMSVGIGAIVFLVSVGYGLQNMVIKRIARLDEMRQADVRPQVGGKIKINDDSILAIREVQGVNKVLPLISVVGRVNYQNSVSDMVVYGVTSDYLNESAIKPVKGKNFESNDLVGYAPEGTVGGLANLGKESKVLGISVEEKEEVTFTIDPEDWVRIRKSPDSGGEMLGFTRRVGGEMKGVVENGSDYLPGQNKWIKMKAPIWDKKSCDVGTDAGCEEGKYIPRVQNDGSQLEVEGYTALVNVNIRPREVVPQVLGDSTDASMSGEWVSLASESATVAETKIERSDLSPRAVKQAVVNKAMIKVLGLSEEDAIGKKFNASFVITGNLLTKNTSRLESNPAEYTIVGLVPDDKTAVFYVPFTDLKGLGVDVYSQVKVVVKNQDILPKIRRQIESMGMQTTSVADTVSQVNSLFGIFRTVLLLLGMVALFVASLGMFNTLTVSLLERTREVGLMKAMGMRSSEVQELFLTESMIMGVIGGWGGVLMGFGSGKLVGLLLSFFSVSKGSGYIDIAYLPPAFLFTIVVLSLFVGLVTGIYPARRATRISALNALRYE